MKKISNKNAIKEKEIQKQINCCLEKYESFCFDAGAGAGKTYALQKSIEYLLQGNKGFWDHNQQILCITYTNAAKDEILSRIGRNSEVMVSTIHDFLWNFISVQQILLVEQHKKRLRKEQERNKSIEKKFLEKYSLDKNIFEDKINSKRFRDVFNKNYYKKADPFRESMKSLDNYFDRCLTNVKTFKDVVNGVNNSKKYESAIKSSNNKVRYIPTQNRDDLANYIISHDTLLDYCKNIIKDNDILKRLFLDRYPYVLIDEYQDTDERVVALISSIRVYATSKGKSFLIGYFGDSLQNIYENGIGALSNKCQYKIIQKKFNRRSTTPIISTIERIRNDGFGQRSIYEDYNDGLCEFYLSSIKFNLKGFLEEHGLHTTTACLFLKNSDITKKRGFGELLDVLSHFPRFKGANYGNLSNEFLQKNVQHIGWFLRDILTFVDFIVKVTDNNTAVKDIIDFAPHSMKQITFNNLRELIENLRHKLSNFETLPLENCIRQVSQIYNENYGSEILKNIFLLDNDTNNIIDSIRINSFDYLCYSDGEYLERLDTFFNLSFAQFKRWYEYVFDKNISNKVNYYTLHGSKGLEFENVVVVLQDKFAGRKNFCRYFFDNYDCQLSNEDKEQFNKVRNLLYVACSRAKKKLYVIYEAGDYEELKKDKNSKTLENISTIFSGINYIDSIPSN